MLNPPLKKIIFIITLAIFSLFIGLRTAAGFFYLFFWLLLVLPAACFILAGLSFLAGRLSIRRPAAGKLEEEDSLSLELTVENKGLLPLFNLVLEDYLPCAAASYQRKRLLIESFLPSVSKTMKYSCLCSRRGKYRLGPVTAYFFDPLGIFYFRRVYPVYSQLYVYPKAFSIAEFPRLKKGFLPWFGLEAGRSAGDEGEFYGIREYRPGDPLKTIHWISTARKNRLIVRQLQRQTYLRATMIFNLEKDKNYGEGRESICEYTIKIAASIAQYLSQKGVSLEVAAHAQELTHIPANKGSQHLEDIFKFLAEAQPESRVSLAEVFQEFCRFIPDDTTLIIIMSDKDWEYMPAMLPLAKRNISLVPVILLSSTFLRAFEQKDFFRDVQAKTAQALEYAPIIIGRQDNLEEVFTYRYD